MSNPRKGGLGGLLGPVTDDDTPAPETDTPTSPPEAPAASTTLDGRTYTPRRRRGPAREKMTVQIKTTLRDALDMLTERDGTLIYEELEEALTRHLSRKKINIPKD